VGIFVKTEAEKQKQLDKQLSEAVEDMSYYNSQSKNEKILKKIQDLLDEGADVNSTLIPTSPPRIISSQYYNPRRYRM
jgi:hypothetical protein